MKTLSMLSGLLSLSSLILLGSLAMGCALESGPTSTEEEDSVAAAQSRGDEDGSNGGSGNHELVQPIAPNIGDLGQCQSCGPGPQPWQDNNALNRAGSKH
jgi:hypothetical protein